MSEYFLGDSGERRGGALTPLQKLKIFLRYVADPGFQTGAATDIGVRQPTVSNVIAEVIQKIIRKYDYWIHFPSTDEEFEREKVAWQQAYNFPCAIGAIDCTHIPILKPAAHGDEYINRKGFPSLNVLATALKCLQAWISLGRTPFMMPVFGPILQSNQLSAEIKFVLFS
nr:unnamed protein product [Callosobruchus chinensis]